MDYVLSGQTDIYIFLRNAKTSCHFKYDGQVNVKISIFNQMHNYLNTIFKKATIHWRTIVVYQYSVKHNTILTVCDHKGYYMLWELNFTYITTTDYQEKCVEVKCVLNIKQYLWCVFYMQRGARGGVVVKVLCYKPTGRGFDSRWCHWNFSGT